MNPSKQVSKRYFNVDKHCYFVYIATMKSVVSILSYFPAERERRRSREPWGETAIPEERGTSDCLAAVTTTATEILSESPRPATPSAVSSLVEDEFFDFGSSIPREEEEEIISVTTTTTIAPVVERPTEPEMVSLDTIVVEEEEEERTAAVGRESSEPAAGEEEETTPSSSSRRRTTTTTTTASPRATTPNAWLEDSEDEESADVLPSLRSLVPDVPDYVQEADDFLAISRWVAQLPQSGRSLYERSLRSTVRHEAISGGRVGICQGNGEGEIGPLGRTSSGENRIWDLEELRNLREATTDWSSLRLSSLLPATFHVCFASRRERDGRWISSRHQSPRSI